MELAVIEKMGFSGYFLIVQDFINWAKERRVPVGPGRGSGAGSIVAWALRITDLDPLRWNLLFERFLNPERVSMPDFDVDFCQNRRDEVIRYVVDKYGKDNVGQIITFGSLKARSVIRDVVRVMGLPFAEGDRIAKLVPDPVQGKTPPLKDLVFGSEKHAPEPRLRELWEKPKLVQAYTDAEGRQQEVTDEGHPRHRHVARGAEPPGRACTRPGWSSPTSRSGSTCRSTSDAESGQLVSQFAKDDAEAAGLVKFDFLGLKTLTVIDDAIRLIRRNHPAAGRAHRPSRSPSTTRPSTSSSAAATPPACSRWSRRASPRW